MVLYGIEHQSTWAAFSRLGLASGLAGLVALGCSGGSDGESVEEELGSASAGIIELPDGIILDSRQCPNQPPMFPGDSYTFQPPYPCFPMRRLYDEVRTVTVSDSGTRPRDSTSCKNLNLTASFSGFVGGKFDTLDTGTSVGRWVTALSYCVMPRLTLTYDPVALGQSPGGMLASGEAFSTSETEHIQRPITFSVAR